MLMLSVGISAQSSVVYFSEDFEQSGQQLPRGWDASDNACTYTYSNAYIWQVLSDKGYATGGGTSYGAHLNADAAYTQWAALKTPAINLPAMRDCILRFRVRNDANGGNLGVYVSTDGGATYLNNEIASGLNPYDQWTEYEFPLSAFRGQSVKIVFVGRLNTSSAVETKYYLDDISVSSSPECQEVVNPFISNMSDHGVTLNWGLRGVGFGDVPDTFHIEIFENGQLVKTVNQAMPFNSIYQYAVTGLQSNRTYQATIQSNCLSEYAGMGQHAATVTFQTLKPAINLPVDENFDALNTLPDGSYSEGAELNAQPAFAYGQTGRSIKLTASENRSAYICYQMVNATADNMEIDFRLRRSSTNTTAKFVVGYVTDPADIQSSFMPIAFDSLTNGNGWESRRYNTAGNSDQTTPVMVAIMLESGYDQSLYVDNFRVHVIPTCVRPEHVTVEGVTANSVTLSWDAANAPQVSITATNLTDNTVLTQTATSSPYTFTGLTQMTSYDFRLTGICSRSDHSEETDAVRARTGCSVAVEPTFNESFNYVGAGLTPECWTMGWLNLGTSTAETPFTSTPNEKHGRTGKSMSVVNQPQGTISYLSTPCLPIDRAGAYDVQLWVKRDQASSFLGEQLDLWVNSVPNDTVGGTRLGSIHRHYMAAPAEAQPGWYRYQYNIPAQGNKYIIVVGKSEEGGALYFDDMAVIPAPSCRPVYAISPIRLTPTGATFGWTTDGTETQWTVDYTVTQNGAYVTDYQGTVSQPQVAVSGLTPDSRYDIDLTVRALCQAGDTAEATEMVYNFSTECHPIAELPYKVGFEASESRTDQHPLPFCWSRINDGTENYYPYIVNDGNQLAGSGCLFNLQSSFAEYGTNPTIVLPAVDTQTIPMNSVRVSMNARVGSSPSQNLCPGRIVVGVMDNSMDITTFTPVDTIDLNTASYAKFSTDLTTYAGQGQYVALMFPKPQGAASGTGNEVRNFVYVDNLRLEYATPCADLQGSATVSNITENSVQIRIEDETATSGWSYAYGPAGTPLAQMTTADTTGGFAIPLTGLQSGTQYELYVRRHCADGSYSTWSEAVTFATTSVPATMPYVCDFESTQENNQWQFVNTGSNNLVIGTTSQAIYDGGRGLYVSSDGGATYGYNNRSTSTSYAYRTIHFNSEMYYVEFRWACNGGERSYDFARAMLVGASEPLLAGNNNINTEADFIGNAVLVSGWQKYTGMLDMRNRAGDYNLVFMWTNDNSGGSQYPLSVDNIIIEEQSCMPVSNAMVSNLTATTATIMCQNSSAAGYEFIVDSLGLDLDNLPQAPVYHSVESVNSAAVTGLEPNTDYYYSIRQICQSGDTSMWLAPQSFHTGCAVKNLPYVENFEDTRSVGCWLVMADPNNAAGTVRRTTSVKNAGRASMQITNAAVVSPELNASAGLNRYMIDGYVYTTQPNQVFTIGLTTDPSDVSAAEIFGTVTVQDAQTWTEFTVYFSDLDLDDYADYRAARNIVIMGSNGTFYFDDLNVDLAPSCPRPTEISMTGVTPYQFTLDFTDVSSATQWAVRLNGQQQIINQHPAVISGLQPVTDYRVEVAAICSATDTSLFTYAGHVRTECAPKSMPWTCGFEAVEGFTKTNQVLHGDLEAQCWNTLNVEGSDNTFRFPHYFVYSGAGYFHSGAQSLMLHCDKGVRNLTLILPEMAAPSSAVNVSYWYSYATTGSAEPTLEFGYITDVNVDSSFHILAVHQKFTDWTFFEINTSDYPNIPQNARLAIRYNGYTAAGTSYSGYRALVDDITVNEVRSCSATDVPQLSQVTAQTVDVAITDTNTQHTAWQYVVVPKGSAPSSATPQAASVTTFTVTGLTAETEYDLYVRAVCGQGDESAWQKASFTTQCLPFAVTVANPFYDSFENMEGDELLGGCYNVEDNDPLFEYIKGLENVSSAYTGDISLHFGRYGYAFDGTYHYDKTAYRLFHFEAGATYKASMQATTYKYANQYADILIGQNADAAGMTLVASLKLDMCDGPQIGYDANYDYLYDLSECWQQVTGYFTVPQTGDYYIGIRSRVVTDDVDNRPFDLYVDDLEIIELTGCLPSTVTVSAVTTDNATITIDQFEAGATYEYFVLNRATNDTAVSRTLVTTAQFTTPDIPAETEYVVRVRRVCQAGESEWVSASFQTDCGVITITEEQPYVDDFEAYDPNADGLGCYETEGNNPTNGNEAVKVYSSASSWTQMARSGAQYVRMYYTQANCPNGQKLYRRFHFEAGHTYNISLYLNATSQDALVSLNVGTAKTALAEIASLVVPPTSSGFGSDFAGGYKHLTAAFTPAVTDDYYLCLWGQFADGQTTGNIYIDDYSVEVEPACRVPEEPASIVSTTMTTMNVSVPMHNMAEAEVGVALNRAGVSVRDITTTVRTTTGQVTLTGLTQGTAYAVFYRYVCDQQTVSRWSEAAVDLTTETDCFAPQRLHVEGVVNDHHAAFAWGAAPLASSYEYILSQNGTAVDQGTTTQNNVTYNNLTPELPYTFSVRAFCSGDSTEWETVSVHTSCAALTLPFSCGFETPEICSAWNINNVLSGPNSLIIGNDRKAVYTGRQALYISNDGQTYNYVDGVSGSTADVYLEVPEGEYTISYDWKGRGSQATDYARVFLLPYGQTITQADLAYDRFYYYLPENAIQADQIYGLYGATDWQHSSYTVEVPQSGVYRLVVAAVTNDASSYGSTVYLPGVSVDNISVSSVNCPSLSRVSAKNITAHTATVEVSTRTAGDIFEYALTTEAELSQVTGWTEADSATAKVNINLTGLDANTTYYFYARAVCSQTEKSEAMLAIIKTPAEAAQIPYVCHFEADEQLNNWTLTSANDFFTIGTATENGGLRSLYVTNDSVSNEYTAAVEGYSYAYLPVHFPEGTYNISFDWKSNGNYYGHYLRALLMPTSTKINDDEQITGLSYYDTPTTAYSLSEMSYIPSEWGNMGTNALYGTTDWNMQFSEVYIPQEADYYLIFAWYNVRSDVAASQAPAAIDNISITENTCPAIQEANIAYDAEANSITFTVSGAEDASGLGYQLSEDASFAEITAQGTTQAGVDTFTVTGLNASTRYYARLWTLCSANETSPRTTIIVRTACGEMTGFPYYEGFESFKPAPQYNIPADVYAELASRCWTETSTSTAARAAAKDDVAFAGTKSLLIENGTSVQNNMLSLPPMAGLSGKRFSVAYKNDGVLPSSAGIVLGYMTDAEDATTFVAIDTLAKYTTWTEYATTLAGIPQGARLTLNVVGAQNMRIDNIRINELAQGGTYVDTLCFGDPYYEHGLSLASGQLEPGDTTLNYIAEAVTRGQADSIFSVQLHIRAEISTYQQDTICEGTAYNQGGWQIATPRTKTYFRHLNSAVGCDSIVALDLFVVPMARTIDQAICYGDYYDFYGRQLTTPGQYTYAETTPQGCQSVITLNLSVVDSLVLQYEQICPGSSFIWNAREYTQPGVYRSTGVGSFGCPVTKELHLSFVNTDSILDLTICQGARAFVVDTVLTTAGQYLITRPSVYGCDIRYHVTLTVTPAPVEEVYDDACQDRLYYGFGLNGVAVTADTVITVRTVTAAMCDSIANIHITYHATDTYSFDVHINAGETYEWNNTTYSTAGQYTETFQNRFGCDSVVTLNLSVGDAVDNVETGRMRIAPNPVRMGQTVVIFTEGIHNVAKIEVINSFGATVDILKPTSTPMTLTAPMAAGVYHIRITTEQGDIFVDKLIVE